MRIIIIGECVKIITLCPNWINILFSRLRSWKTSVDRRCPGFLLLLLREKETQMALGNKEKYSNIFGHLRPSSRWREREWRAENERSESNNRRWVRFFWLIISWDCICKWSVCWRKAMLLTERCNLIFDEKKSKESFSWRCYSTITDRDQWKIRRGKHLRASWERHSEIVRNRFDDQVKPRSSWSDCHRMYDYFTLSVNYIDDWWEWEQ